MAGEAAFWNWLRDQITVSLPPGAYHPQRLEDSITPGIPDLNLCVQGREFWLEFKSLLNWPVRPETPLRFERYTLEQRKWLRSRWNARGRAYLVLRVANTGEILAWNGVVAGTEVEGQTRLHAVRHACASATVKGFSLHAFLRDLERERLKKP